MNNVSFKTHGCARPQGAVALIRTALGAVFISLATGLYGQQSTPGNSSEDQVIELDPFDVTSVATDRYQASNTISGTAMNSRLKDVPMTINVITSEFLEDAIIGNIERVLDFNSSVTQTTRGEVSNQNAIFSLRGFRNRNILLDGVMGGDFIPRYLIDRIEVVKGPNTLYGQSDPGGLVNMISKRPTGKDSSSLTTRFGEDDTYAVDADVNIAQVAPGLGMRLLGSYETSGGWRWRDDKTEKFGAFSSEWQATDTTKIRVLASKNTRSGTPTNRATYSFMTVPTDLNGDGDTNDRIRGVAEASARFNNDFLPWHWTSETSNSGLDQDASYYQLNVQQALGEKINLQYNYMRANQENTVTFREYNTFNPAGNVTALYTTTYNENNEDAHTLNALMRAETGAITHNLIAGVRYTKSHRFSDNFRLRPGTGAERAVLNSLEIGGRTFRHVLNKSEILAGAEIWNDDMPTRAEMLAAGFRANQNGDSYEEITTAYLSDSFTMLDERLRILAGIRSIEITGYGYQLDGSGGAKRTSRDVSHQIGVNYAVNDRLVLFGNQATSFDPNGFDSNTNDYYPAEESDAIELGAKLDGLWDGKLSGSVSWFLIDKANVVRNDYNPVTFRSDTEISDDRSDGYDVELFLNLSKGWQTTLGYTHLNARTVRTQTEALGLALEGAAPDRLTFFTTYSFSDGGLKGLRMGGGAIRAWGPIQQFGTSTNQLVVEDGYTQINLFARYTTQLFEKPTTFGLNISNLTNEFMIRARANTNSPRQIMGSIRVDF
jgi:iron complex outermembrane receptor protein